MGAEATFHFLLGKLGGIKKTYFLGLNIFFFFSNGILGFRGRIYVW